MVLLSTSTVTSPLLLPLMKTATAVVSILTVFVLLYLIPESLRFILYSLDLERQMQRRLVELDAANKVAIQAHQVKSDFMAFLCHEIRNPLHIITANTDFLLETALHAEQREYVRSVNDSAQLMTSIVSDVLDLERLQAYRMSFERIPVDLVNVCSRLMKNVQHQAQSRRVKLVLDYAHDAPRFVIGDPTRIHQLLLNLLSNSIKFTGSDHGVGAVTLSVALHHPPSASVKVGRKKGAASTRLTVRAGPDEEEDSRVSLLSATSIVNSPLARIRALHRGPVRSPSGHSISMSFAKGASDDPLNDDADSDANDDRFVHDAEEEMYEEEEEEEAADDDGSPASSAARPHSHKRPRQRALLRFSVRDTGMGISPHALPQLFSPYTQAKLSIVREKGGTGLGLSICREIIASLRGEIRVRSELGKGSEFVFIIEFPLSSDAEYARSQRGEVHEAADSGAAERRPSVGPRTSESLTGPPALNTGEGEVSMGGPPHLSSDERARGRPLPRVSCSGRRILFSVNVAAAHTGRVDIGIVHLVVLVPSARVPAVPRVRRSRARAFHPRGRRQRREPPHPRAHPRLPPLPPGDGGGRRAGGGGGEERQQSLLLRVHGHQHAAPRRLRGHAAHPRARQRRPHHRAHGQCAQ